MMNMAMIMWKIANIITLSHYISIKCCVLNYSSASTVSVTIRGGGAGVWEGSMPESVVQIFET